MGGSSELERIIRYLYDSVQHLRTASTVTGLAGMAPSALRVCENFIIGSKGGPVLTAGRYGGEWWAGNATIVGWNLGADVSGSVALDIKKCSYVNYPTVVSIVASSPPALTSQIKNQDTGTLTGWTLSMADGDWLEFWITGTPANVTELTLGLYLVR